MAIVAAGVIIPIKFEMQREQEQEMIHRGVQYSRAIRAYYKKLGRYPTKLEDLDNTGGLRYLRKHYEDPLNKNRDFKLLHYGDPGVTLGGGLSIGGGGIAGASPAGSPAGINASGAGSSAFGGSAFGNSASGSSGFGNSGVNSSGVFSQSSGGTSSNSQAGSGQGTNGVPGSDPTDASTQVQSGQVDASSGSQQVLGSGGPIVGVSSINKNTTIREFNHKKKYNEWQFVYDPATDRGALITTPNQPALQVSGIPGSNAQTGGNGSSSGQSSPFGQSSSFGQSSGFGSSPSPGGASAPVQPSSNSPQQ